MEVDKFLRMDAAQPDPDDLLAHASLPLVPRTDGEVLHHVLSGGYMDPAQALNVVRIDGWQNVSTGIGMPGFDKRLNTRFTTEVVTYRDAVEMWRGDDIAARVVETLPGEALEKGWEMNIADEGEHDNLKEMVEDLYDELEIEEALQTALKFERAYGGGALLIGANDGQDMSMPLDINRIVELKWVTPLEPIEIYPLKSYEDPNSPKFGKPELYQLAAIARGPALGMSDPMSRALPSTSTIHESRLIIFPGLRVSKFQTKTSVGGMNWGDSVFTRMARVLADFNLGYSSLGIILSEHGTPIFSMKELAKLVNSNRLDVIRARLALLFQQMSTARAAVIDAEENYERKAMPLSGIDEAVDRLAQRLAAAVEMPLTKLLGQSPKGLGNEGDSDLAFWHKNVARFQKTKIRRPLRQLIKILISATRQPEPAKWSIKFHPLEEQNETEIAQSRSTQAQTDVAYITAGVLSPEDVRKSRFSGDYSFETQVDFEAYEQQAAMEAQPLTPEDIAAMGYDPNDPEQVAQAEAEAAAQQPPPGGPETPAMEGTPDTGEAIEGAPDGAGEGVPTDIESAEVQPAPAKWTVESLLSRLADLKAAYAQGTLGQKPPEPETPVAPEGELPDGEEVPPEGEDLPEGEEAPGEPAPEGEDLPEEEEPEDDQLNPMKARK